MAEPAPPPEGTPSPAASLADQAKTLRRIEAILERMTRILADLAGEVRRG